jgi:hypothetical protein
MKIFANGLRPMVEPSKQSSMKILPISFVQMKLSKRMALPYVRL